MLRALDFVYPPEFLTPISVPVLVDTKDALQAPFSQRNLPARFSFSIEQAICMADRHLYVTSSTGTRVTNPMATVLRWTSFSGDRHFS